MVCSYNRFARYRAAQYELVRVRRQAPTCRHIERNRGGCGPAERPQAPCRVRQHCAAGLQQRKCAQASRAPLHNRPADSCLGDMLRLPLLALVTPHTNLHAGMLRGDELAVVLTLVC